MYTNILNNTVASMTNICNELKQFPNLYKNDPFETVQSGYNKFTPTPGNNLYSNLVNEEKINQIVDLLKSGNNFTSGNDENIQGLNNVTANNYINQFNTQHLNVSDNIQNVNKHEEKVELKSEVKEVVEMSAELPVEEKPTEEMQVEIKYDIAPVVDNVEIAENIVEGYPQNDVQMINDVNNIKKDDIEIINENSKDLLNNLNHVFENNMTNDIKLPHLFHIQNQNPFIQDLTQKEKDIQKEKNNHKEK
jgi:hypothetical protein